MQAEQAIQPTAPLVPHPPEERGLLAPSNSVKPKKEIQPSSESYEDFLKGLCKRIDTECDERADIRARRYTRNHNYWWGGERRWQYWTANGFKSLDPKVVKKLFSNNQFAYQVRTILSVVTRSNSRLVISPAPSATDDSEKVAAAKVASRTVDHDKKEKLNAAFMVREWTDKLLCGFSVRGQWYSTEGSTAKARAPIFEQREVPQEGLYVCTECGMTGPGSYAPQHGQGTGHSAIEVFPGESVTVPFHAGYEEIPDGDCLTVGISPYQFDLAPDARDIASSAFARWQRKVRKSKLKRAYAKLDLKNIPSTDLPVMLRAEESTRTGKRTEGKSDFTVLKTYWVSPDEYFEFASLMPMKCVSGLEVPAMTVLSDACPNGMRLDICGDQLLDIRPEVKEDCLSKSDFHIDPLSWEAKGLDDAVELQRWIDDIHTLYIQIQLREALGITLYDKDFGFDGGVFTGEVGMVKGVTVPPEKSVQQAMNIWSGQQPNQSIFSGLEYVQQSQTNVTGAFPSLSGSNMEGSETARGRIILREQSLQGMNVPLILAALHDVIWAKQNLKLKKQYWTSERYVPYLSEGEPLGGRWFSASDLDADFVVDVEADSWMPTTRMDQIDNMTTAVGGEAAMQVVGGFAGLAASQSPLLQQIGRKGLELLGAPSEANPDEKDLRVARHRYAILKKAVEMSVEQGQPVDNQMGELSDDQVNEKIPPEVNTPLTVPPQIAMKFAMMPSLQPLPDVDNHQVLAEFYKNAIKDSVDSDGIENHPITKAVLMLLIKAHENQGIMDAQSMQMAAMQANAPQIAMEQAQQSGESAQSHQQDLEKTKMGQHHELAKQKQGSKLKQEEIAAKGEADTNKESELAKVKV